MNYRPTFMWEYSNLTNNEYEGLSQSVNLQLPPQNLTTLSITVRPLCQPQPTINLRAIQLFFSAEAVLLQIVAVAVLCRPASHCQRCWNQCGCVPSEHCTDITWKQCVVLQKPFQKSLLSLASFLRHCHDPRILLLQQFAKLSSPSHKASPFDASSIVFIQSIIEWSYVCKHPVAFSTGNKP